MPMYKVIAKGFHHGELYDPEGKRKTLHVDKPFNKKNPMPKWLSEMPKESESLKAKRLAYKKAQAELEAEKAKQDAKDISAASTEGNGEKVSFIDKAKDVLSGKSSNVETV